MSDLFDWYADVNDSDDFQWEVLNWLERCGVPKEVREFSIYRVDLEREGEGARIRMDCYVSPSRIDPDTGTPAREFRYWRLYHLPPPRPEECAA